MKKITLFIITTISLFACNLKENETTSITDDAAMDDFKENSKIILAGFEAFTKNDTTVAKVTIDSSDPQRRVKCVV